MTNTLSDQLPGILKASEEGSELAQAVLKAMGRLSEFEMKDGNKLYEKIVEEFGDVLASTAYVLENCSDEFLERVSARHIEKLKLYDRLIKNKVFDEYLP